MKIIVPMAGIGSRLRPHTLTIPKPLTVIAGKPIVQRLVEDITAVVNQKIDEIAFIIGPSSKGFPADTSDKLLAIAKELGAKGSVYVQEQALGTAHAIHCAKDSLSGPCVVAFADTLFKADFTLDAEADGAIWVKQVADPSAFGVVKLKDGFITDFVEKPKEFVSDLAIIGIYYFKDGDKLLEEINHLIDHDIRPSGEFQLTEVLESLKQQGAKFLPGKVDAWMDCGKKDPTVDTNKQVLNFEQAAGNNLVSEDVVLENSKIIQPCYVGNQVVLKNTILGPNVSIGANSMVENAIITNSLIQSNVTITNATLDNAMIGNYAKYNGKYTSVSIGDYTEVNIKRNAKRIVLIVYIGFLCNPFLSFSQDSIADAMSVSEKTNIQFQEHFFKALSEKAINHYKNAIQNLEECNHLIPQNTAVLFEISKNYLSLNNIFEAAQYGELALATSPNNYWILEHLVTVHKTARDFKTAIEYQQKLILIKPKKREQLIILHLQNNDLKSAKKLLNQLEKENVLTARLRRIKNRLDVKSLKKTTNTLHKNQGLIALEKAFTQQKSYAVLKKIFVLSEKENPSNLLKYSKIGLSLFPAQPLVYLVNGKALNSKKDYKKALESLENGIDFVIDDKKMESNFYLAMVISYKGLGNVKQARNYQKKATLLLATINKKK